jgi:hypothetical protein
MLHFTSPRTLDSSQRYLVEITFMNKTLLGLFIVSCASSVFGAEISRENLIRPAGTLSYQSEDPAELVAYGEQVWNDKKLSRNGKTACADCHKKNTRMFKNTFLEPYPHEVKLPYKKLGLTSVDAEQVVQLMVVLKMKNDLLPWESKKLAALTSYTVEVVQKQFTAHKSR